MADGDGGDGGGDGGRRNVRFRLGSRFSFVGLPESESLA